MSTNSMLVNSPGINSLHQGDEIHNYNFSERKNKAQFEKLTMRSDDFRDYLKPSFTDEVIRRLNDHHILLIGGSYSFNKGHFLKYVTVTSRQEGQEIKECTNLHNFHGLSAAIYEEASCNILILNYLTAKDISYRFQELKRLALAKSHKIIISTEEPYSAWLFEEDMHHSHWFEIPDKDIYSKEVLQDYLTDLLQKQRIDLPINKNLVTDELSGTEQIERLVELLSKHKGTLTAQYVLEVVRSCRDIDSDSLQYWFDNLSGLHKLVVIGVALFDGAYENQLFAGFERILNYAWRKRDKDLKSIDYEDLIPLASFFKTDGISIRSKLREQRKKIIKLAWRTHKRYILSTLPVLRDIVIESSSEVPIDLELLGTENYRNNIRNVISETLSDIGLQSFYDVENTLLHLASHRNIQPQIVVAKAISRWKLYDENKIYEILERWQYNTEVHHLMRSYIGSDDNNYLPLSYIQATVILTLYFTSQYEKNRQLSEKNKDLLLRFRRNRNELVVERMKWTLDMMTASHPDSLADILRDEFLSSFHYVEPIAFGLAKAYNNGFAANVKGILEGWMKYYDDNKVTGVEDPASYTHRDKVLAAVIKVLGLIDYVKVPLITVEYTYGLLENYRKNIHKYVLRKYLIETIVNIIEANFYTNKATSINMISNVDKEERRYIVEKFVDRYLNQREELTDGDYEITFNDTHCFDTWINQDERPKTPVEKLMSEWKKNQSNTLSQIAINSFVEFDRIEILEKESLDKYHKNQEDQKQRNELRKKELEQMGVPQYDGNISISAETLSFVKLCTRFVLPVQQNVFRNIAIFILQENLNEIETEKLLLKMDDNHTVQQILYVYKMYRNGQLQYVPHPLPQDFQATLFFTLSFWMVPSGKRRLLRAFAPFLMKTSLNGLDVSIILNKIKFGNTGWIKLVYYLCKYPAILIIVLLLITYFLFKIIY